MSAAMKVHSALGTGLLESAHEAWLTAKLHKRGLRAEKQVALPVVHEGVTIDLGYRMDLVVKDLVVVELKCAEEFSRVYYAQLLSYLRLSRKNVGWPISFHVAHFRDGVKCLVNGRTWE